MLTKGPVPETKATWGTALQPAKDLGDVAYHLRATSGLWAYHIHRGEFRAALALARKFRSLAATAAEKADQLVGDRMLGTSLHYSGVQAEARAHLEHMLDDDVAPVPLSHVVRFHLDQRVMARVVFARVLWLQGFPEQAMQIAQMSVDEAHSPGQTASLCCALAEAAGQVALLSGNMEALGRFAAMLLDCSARHSLTLWNACGRGLKGALLINLGDVSTGLPLLRSGLDDLRNAKFAHSHMVLVGALAEGFARAGQATMALEVIDEALDQSEQNEERWCVANLLCIKGELVLATSGGEAALDSAEECFRQSLELARRQGALSWELRAATRLARIWRDRGEPCLAHDMLAWIYGRFSEGFDTADLRAAKDLLDELG
jgi:tetratricopeptide (TPR) repeat protein